LHSDQKHSCHQDNEENCLLSKAFHTGQIFLFGILEVGLFW
jgi:hypothetical protein